MNITMGIPQILLIACSLWSFWEIAKDHGKLRTGRYSIWNECVGVGITYTLLIWGGFFG